VVFFCHGSGRFLKACGPCSFCIKIKITIFFIRGCVRLPEWLGFCVLLCDITTALNPNPVNCSYIFPEVTAVDKSTLLD
jgi:hypothetical protein